VDLCAAKLERATQLIEGLGGEKTRWRATASELNSQCAKLVGDMLLAAAAVNNTRNDNHKHAYTGATDRFIQI
jgi:hypothetical protein